MRKYATTLVLIGALVVASMGPAAAQDRADSARAEAFGAEISGLVDLGPLPDPVVAEVPPGEEDSDSFLEVPAEPLAFSGTLSGDVQASRDATIAATLQGEMDAASAATLPSVWNARAHAITEDLGVLFAGGNGDFDILEEPGEEAPDDPDGSGETDNPDEAPDNPGGGADSLLDDDEESSLEVQDDAEGAQPDDGGAEAAEQQDGGDVTVQQEDDAALLTAEVVEAEAVASCDDGDPVFATGSRVQQLRFAGEPLPVLDEVLDTAVELIVQGEPNEDVLANVPAVGEVLAELGLEIVAWDTNWDGGTGTTDGSDTVWVNALRVSVVEDSPLGELVGAQDITVSHAAASVDCDEDVDPAEDSLRDIAKESSEDTVAPGDTFTYTIDVPNADDACTLENVQVVDTISGPAGSQILSTSPEADDIDDLTVTWNDIGPIAPGETETLTIEVQVPDDAQDGDTYREDVAITADCDGVPVEGELDFDGPRVADADVGPAEPRLPETGGGAVLAAMLLLGAGTVTAWLRRMAA